MQTSHPTLVVSIHDVSPLTAGRVREMLADLAEVGVERTSLLVIPNHHGKAPVEADPGFGCWVREAVEAGHEAVLHGYYHLRPTKEASLGQKLVTECYTAGEGEFFDLPEEDAFTRLEQAKGEFARLGLFPTGFIAPAWLLGPEAERAVARAGFIYTTRLGTVKDFRSGREAASQSLVWSVRAGWRRIISLAWNAFLARKLRENPLVRIGLHPPDWDHPSIRRQILALTRQAVEGRVVRTYEEWVG